MYPIRDEGVSFSAGSAAGGKQVLMGLLYPELVSLFFDKCGVFSHTEARRLPFEAPTHSVSKVHVLEDHQFAGKVDMLLAAWQQDIAFKPGLIQVQKFFLPDRHLGIADIPKAFDAFLRNPAIIEDEVERKELSKTLDDWKRKRMFVLWWGKDYWLDEHGEIDST